LITKSSYQLFLPVRFGLFVANSPFVTAAAWQILSESAWSCNPAFCYFP